MNFLSTDQIRWNKKYRQLNLHQLSLRPSSWLPLHEELLLSLSKGKALDIACGSGKNACYLAALNFEVDAVDVSDVAMDWLQEKVQAADLSVFPQVRNLEMDMLPPTSYEVILNFYYLQRSLFPSIIAGLAPGGLLFFETFSRDHIEVLGKRMNPAFVLERGELLKAFSSLEVLK